MFNWSCYPFLRISLVFVPGVYCGLLQNNICSRLELVWLGSFLLFWFFLKTTGRSYRMRNPIIGAVGLTLFFIIGMLRSHWQPYQRDDVVEQAEYYQALVVESSTNAGIELVIERIWSSGNTLLADDRVLLRQTRGFPGSKDGALLPPLYPGDRVMVRGSPTGLRGPANPLEFDYAQYLSSKNIFWQHWIHPRDLIHLVPAIRHQAGRLPVTFRSRLQKLLVSHLPPGSPLEISRAMLLGERQAVSPELKDSFADSGTIHILAVSGLHMGILYWLLLRVFGNLRGNRWFKWVFLFLCLWVLWAYAVITGMAPATQRAAIMWSILLLGNSFSRHSNAKNTLGASAVCILYLDPYQLYSVGFQLSFLALAGILYLQPLLKEIWITDKRTARYFWELITVSVAAQTAVLPVSIYYFHQLPSYFLLANLLLVPLAFAIVITGVLFFALSIIPIISKLLSVLLGILTKMAAGIVKLVAALPGSIIEFSQLGAIEVIALYLFILLMVSWLKTRRRVRLRCLVLLCCMAIIWQTNSDLPLRGQQIISVYHIPGHTAVDFITGSSYASVTDRDLARDPGKLAYKAGNFRRAHNLCQSTCQLNFDPQGYGLQAWRFNGKDVLLVKSFPYEPQKGNVKWKFDFVIMTNNSAADFINLSSWVDAETWVIDGSNQPWISHDVQARALKKGVKIHNSWRHGAKIINL